MLLRRNDSLCTKIRRVPSLMMFVQLVNDLNSVYYCVNFSCFFCSVLALLGAFHFFPNLLVIFFRVTSILGYKSGLDIQLLADINYFTFHLFSVILEFFFFLAGTKCI